MEMSSGLDQQCNMIQKTGISGQEKRRSSGFVSDMDGCALSQKKAEDFNRVTGGGDMLNIISGVVVSREQGLREEYFQSNLPDSNAIEPRLSSLLGPLKAFRWQWRNLESSSPKCDLASQYQDVERLFACAL